MRPLFPLALVCLALCFALVVPAQAANSFSSAGEVGQWIMDYYKKPEPERLADALKVLAESDGISEDGQKLIVSFVGAALAEAPKAQEGFFKAVQDHEKARLFAIPAFWFMNNAEGKALIERAGKQWKGTGVSELAKQLLASQSPNLMAGSVRTSLHLDHLWSVFFATGNAEPVLKIASTMNLIGDKNINNHVIGQQAQWSLSANARMHPRVREILETTMEGTQEPLKSRLAEALQATSPR